MTETYIRSLEAQIIGRVFTLDGATHFVLGTDSQTGMARCSRRAANGSDIAYLPMEDVRDLLHGQGTEEAEAIIIEEGGTIVEDLEQNSSDESPLQAAG